jgi:hypothetical protein
MTEDKFWMVYGNGKSAPAMKHHTFELAKGEAERLARTNPGVEFFVMMPVSASKRVDVETKMLFDLDEMLPF